MRRFLAASLTALFLCPIIASAESPPLTRRDGFLLLWNAILRPAFDTKERPYEDVPRDAPGFREITYAKLRGLLDDEPQFRPDEPLLLQDALVWLLRTRNVADPDELTVGTLPTLLERYSLDIDLARGGEPLTQEAAVVLMQRFDRLLAEEEHEVSLYAEKFHGDHTAFGEIFDMHAMTAAHRTLPHNTLVRVTNVENGKSVVVRINDRGPYVTGRDLDLSLGAFTSIAPRSRGKIHARFERLGDVSLVEANANPCGLIGIHQERIARGTRLEPGVPHALSLGGTLRLASQVPFVVRAVRYPDGAVVSVQDWVLPGEAFTLTPSLHGSYLFRLGTKEGRVREMTMRVADCPA